jgi:hypothetical protein
MINSVPQTRNVSHYHPPLSLSLFSLLLLLQRRHITSPLQSPAGQCHVRFEVFTAVTMKNAVVGYNNSVRTSQETHHISTTESSQLMLCKIRRFHGRDYEEYRLLRC